MSSSFARAVRDGLRRHGIVVREHPGCYTRGNGQTSAYAGGIFHHTGAPLDGGFWILVNGRSDLPGPLCNTAGHADGSVTLIAAHPANHAGAAGGSWARPFPDTRNFNRMVWGHEIMYPGSTPMTSAQYRTACILAGVICGILGRPTPEWARLHYETSVTGKWDFGAGRGFGVYFPGDRFRADIWPALHDNMPAPPAPEEDIMASLDDLRRVLDEKIMWARQPREGDPAREGTETSLAAIIRWWDFAQTLHQQGIKQVQERQDVLEAKLDAIAAKLGAGEQAPKA